MNKKTKDKVAVGISEENYRGLYEEYNKFLSIIKARKSEAELKDIVQNGDISFFLRAELKIFLDLYARGDWKAMEQMQARVFDDNEIKLKFNTVDNVVLTTRLEHGEVADKYKPFLIKEKEINPVNDVSDKTV